MTAAVLTVLLMGAASLGGGLALLRGAGFAGTDRPLFHIATALVLGTGFMGWFGFFVALAGQAGPAAFGAGLAAMTVGLWFVPRRLSAPFRIDAATATLLAVLAAVLTMNAACGLAPPIDGDSLAYHFTYAKQIVGEGHLVFVPRAVDGAVPMLQQMTYAAALAIGGGAARRFPVVCLERLEHR